MRSEGDFGAAEETYMDMSALPSFRKAAAPFEEALAKDKTSWDRFLCYNAFLGNNSQAREQVDTLLRLEMNRPGLRRELGPALAYLRGHPDDAALFSRNPALLARMPDALRPLRDRFHTDPGLQQGIQESFKALAEMPEARSEIFPWWETAYSGGLELGTAARGLDEYLFRNPAPMWNLRSRNAQWAANPDAFAWAQYLHGAVRREPELAQAFYKALGIAGGPPALPPATVESTPRQAAGLSANLPPWPPPGQLPQTYAAARTYPNRNTEARAPNVARKTGAAARGQSRPTYAAHAPTAAQREMTCSISPATPAFQRGSNAGIV